jgi:flagellar basal body rod protein FlgG
MSFSLQSLFAVVTISAVFLGGFCLSRNDGRLVKTGKPLDLAIAGEGFFQIQLENVDRTFYTRSGHFHLDPNGTLVAGTAADRRALFPNVSFPPGTIPVFTPSGSIYYYSAGHPDMMITMGTIQLATFVNPQGLKQVGDNLYEATDESGCPNTGEPGSNGTGLIRPGCLELPLSESWLADVKLPHMLMLGVALSACFFLLRELRAQRRELTKLQTLMSNPVPPGTC